MERCVFGLTRLGAGLRDRLRQGQGVWCGGREVLLAISLGLPACQPPIPPPEPTPANVDPVSDHEGPVLETDPISEPRNADEGVVIDAVASDPSGVYAVFLHFKPGSAGWETRRMVAMGSDGYYAAELEPEELYGASSVSYYLEAADATPYHNTSYSPTTGPDAPYRFNLVRAGAE